MDELEPTQPTNPPPSIPAPDVASVEPGAAPGAEDKGSGAGSELVAPGGESAESGLSAPSTERGDVTGGGDRYITGKNGGTIIPFAGERARRAVRARWDKAELVALRALREETGAGSWAEGWSKLIAPQIHMALQGGKGSTQAVALVARSAGLFRPAREDAAPGSAPAVTISLDMARELLDRMRGAQGEGGG